MWNISIPFLVVSVSIILFLERFKNKKSVSSSISVPPVIGVVIHIIKKEIPGAQQAAPLFVRKKAAAAPAFVGVHVAAVVVAAVAQKTARIRNFDNSQRSDYWDSSRN